MFVVGNLCLTALADQTPPGRDHDHEHDEDDSDFDEEDPYGLEDGSSDFEMDELEIDAEEDDSQ